MNQPTYRFEGGSVGIPSGAEVSREFYLGGGYSKAVQSALDRLSCDRGVTPYGTMRRTIDLQHYVAAEVVKLSSAQKSEVFSAKHRLHTARTVGASPFVRVSTEEEPVAHALTVELIKPRRGSGLNCDWLMVRAYLGDFRPPLPWQATVKHNPSALEMSKLYWRDHAYVYDRRLVVPGSLVNGWPRW